MKSRLSSKLAIGAIAASFAAPAFAQHDSDGRFGWLTRWIPPRTAMTDTISGNDFRDNRDSTLSRNDVPLDQTTLTAAAPYGTSGYGTNDTSTYSRDMSSSDLSTGRSAGTAPTATAALPATAVAEGALPATAVAQEPNSVASAGGHTPTASGPAIVYSPAGSPSVAQSAQPGVSAVDESEPALADESARRDGAMTPGESEITARNPTGESEVTARNPSGVDAVQDRTQRDVYTGVEGAGGRDATTAGREGDRMMSQ